MNINIAAQIAGFTDTDAPCDHDITVDEHALACEIAHEMAARSGLDLDALVAKQHAAEAAYFDEMMQRS